MARYDEDDIRPRRRDDEADFMARRDRDDDELEDVRHDDYPARRRNTLMQRRLRHARGEGDDPDLYDEDDYDDYARTPYVRARDPYRGAPGGCTASILYLLLGGIAIAVVILLVGRQFMSNLTANLNVPAQVQRIIASPTPTVRDRGGTIQQIKNLNRLETQSFSVERVIDAGVEGNALQNLLFGDRILLIASGTVVAGVDLSKLSASDVTFSDDGESITLRLPPSEIFQAALDNSRTRVYDRQRGWLAAQDKDLETQARQAAEGEILKAACEGGVLQKSADEAKRSMEQFLKLLDFESVTVIASTGTGCASAPTVPTLPTTTP